MIDLKTYPILAETAQSYATEVLILADAMGGVPVTLVEVMQDFLKVVRQPIIAGGFAVAHHGFVRGTIDIDVISVPGSKDDVEQLKALGYHYESLELPIGSIELLTKSNKGIDFLSLADKRFLESLVSRTVPGLFLNEPVRVISLEDLIILKLLAQRGRADGKGRLDLEHLLAMNFDAAYVELWKTHFGI